MEIVRSRAFSGIEGTSVLELSSQLTISAVLLAGSYFSLNNGQFGELSLPISILMAALALFSPLAIQRSGSTVLIPIVDSCNHCSATPTADLVYDPLSGSFELRSLGRIPRSSEVIANF